MAGYDIKMTTDDTLELDAIIKAWNAKSNSIVTVADGKEGTDFNLDGIQTNTAIFDPINSGVYDINVNGQELTVNVTDASEIPDSVVHQYPYSTFTTSTWADNVGTADMTVNGMVASTFSNGQSSVYSDGANDYGTANGPQDLPQNETFGFAITGTFVTGDNEGYFWVDDGNSSFTVKDINYYDGSLGEFYFQLIDSNANGIAVETNTAFNDGNPHLFVVNKNGDTAADVNIYVDDMTTAKATTTISDNGFDHTNYTVNYDMAFNAANEDGSIGRYNEANVGLFEFNTKPYTQTDRELLKARRPEV